MRTLSLQHPPREIRVAYSASGTLPAAAILRDNQSIVEHKAYWLSAYSIAEASYLICILNSEYIRLKITSKQSKGQGGARDFDNLVWELPIPLYDAGDPLHRQLAALAAECEAVAAGVALTEGAYFTTQRKAIRDALASAGLSARLDAMVSRIPGL
jgi:hypothetical protein